MLLRMSSQTFIPRSLRRQFSLALSTMALLVLAGGVVAIYDLHFSAAATRQLTDERLLRMQQAQDLVQNALLIEVASQRMLAAPSPGEMRDKHDELLAHLKNHDQLVDALGAAADDLSVLDLHGSGQQLRNSANIVAQLMETVLRADQAFERAITESFAQLQAIEMPGVSALAALLLRLEKSAQPDEVMALQAEFAKQSAGMQGLPPGFARESQGSRQAGVDGTRAPVDDPFLLRLDLVGHRQALVQFRDEHQSHVVATVESAQNLSASFTSAHQKAMQELVDRSERNQVVVIILISASLVLAWLVARFFLGGHVLARLQQVSRFLRQGSEQETSTKVPVQGEDEIGEMARAVEKFLEARQQLAETHASLLAEKRRQEELLTQLGQANEQLAQAKTGLEARVAERTEALRRANEQLTSELNERKRAEQELRLAATAFESQEGMLISDGEGTILRVNKAFTEITGYQAEEAVGHKASLLKSDRHDEVFYRNLWQTLDREGAWHGEIWNRRKDGGCFPAWLTVTAVKAEEGRITHYVGTLTDLTQRKEAEEEIRELSFYDQLTQLPNRRYLMDRLQRALASANRSQRAGVLLFIDLDNFKILNDTFGHDHGDLLLREVAQRLGTCTRDGDTVARLGGDEFVVMIEDLGTNLQEAAESARIVSEKILTTLAIPYQVAGHEHHNTPSIGVAMLSAHPQDVDEPLKQAEIAMYQAKSAGRNTVRFFDPEMRNVLTARASLELDLRQALLENQFLLYYQPQVDTAGRVTGAEALIRWRHPVRGIVSPAEFIPLAEDTGLILALGQWVLETACKQLVRWGRRAETADLTLAVNVSARQFRHERFADEVLDTLRRSGAAAERLELELTESLLLDDIEDTIIKMTALKNEGVRFSLDDFGTGYSSLAYLKRLPLHQLKIDQSFVREVLSDPNDAAIASTVVALGQSLGLEVIAEGVETQEQRDFLFGQGCYAFQGYLFGRPVPIDEFERRNQDRNQDTHDFPD